MSCKTSDVLVLLSHSQICTMYVMSLDFKWVGIVPIWFKMNATKVILKYGKWDWYYAMLPWSKHGLDTWDVAISLNAWNEIENIQIMFLRKQLGIKSSMLYLIILSHRDIAMQREYKQSRQSRICLIIHYQSKLWNMTLS